MSIKIKTMMKLVDGEPCRQILDFNMLTSGELPKEYKDEGPCIYAYYDYLGQKYFKVIYDSEGNLEHKFRKGELITEDDFNYIINSAILAGERLHEINKKYKSTYPEHYARKIETVKI